MKNYEINEEAARRAQQANSFYEYREGSATSGYNHMVAEAKIRAEDAKKYVDKSFHSKIDRVVERYSALLAKNINQGNEIRSRVPSVMISGAGNFPTGKKEKQNQAMDRNYKQFGDIQKLLHKIDSIGRGGIRSDQDNAKELIEAKLAEKERNQEMMKKINAYYRKHGTVKGCGNIKDETAIKIDQSVNESLWKKPYAPYELSNNNAEIKRLRGRLEGMEKMAKAQLDDFEFDGGEVVFNREIQRVQIILDDRPTPEFKEQLKSRAFKWAPSQGAWQRQLTANALRAMDALDLKPLDLDLENDSKDVTLEDDGIEELIDQINQSFQDVDDILDADESPDNEWVLAEEIENNSNEYGNENIQQELGLEF